MSDWWTQPSTPSHHPFTPARPLAHGSVSSPAYPHASSSSSALHQSSSRARFIADDLDPADLAASERPKFLPSFASSPAGKLALVSEPWLQQCCRGAGGGGGAYCELTLQGTSPGSTSSPPAARKSPTASARFSSSLAESTSSPRHSRRAPPPIDDDLPPTASLHDTLPAALAVPVSLAPAASALPTPPALLPSATTTALHVFGPPMSTLATLRPFFESIGPVVDYRPGPDGTNWWTVEFADALSASYALRRHGEIVLGRWMLALKVAGPGSTSGLTLVPGVPPPADTPTPTGAGTPMRIQSKDIIKTRPVAKSSGEEYAWEEERAPSGLLGKAAEFIFGR